MITRMTALHKPLALTRGNLMQTTSGELSDGQTAPAWDPWAPTDLDVNSDESEFETDKPGSLISGPEDPRYFDLKFFPEPKQGQHWTDARREQVAAVEARVRQCHIKDNSRRAAPRQGGRLRRSLG